ncbi:MAG TPA: VWA domain-containing protein [Steroidobacteraceae bacterium]|nr:VWA domain-containing protein [Steroidobacteraceae bacterium]
MARKRRAVEVFSLSFLDCICCGFGAVILFYTIISAQSGIHRARDTDSLSAEVSRLEEEVLVGTRNLIILRNAAEKAQTEKASAEARAAKLIADLKTQQLEMSAYDATSLARRERIEKLKADIRSLEAGTRRLEAGSVDRAPPGQDVKAFRDTGGDRRYITGIKMRGKRVLILLDRSASMLHQDVVNVILLRNSDDTKKRAASKWRRAVDTVDWIVAQLPPDAQFQIYGFNTKSEAVLASSAGKWQTANDPLLRSRNVEALNGLIPQDGTSLINAFAAAKALSPLPDQIILITDGLPTQGKSPGLRKYIDAGARARLFDDAVGELPDKVPVDVVLMPMKGDLPAAHRFWQLTRFTNGTLLMPSKDWP